MKKLITGVLLLLFHFTILTAQDKYWQQQVNHTIEVSLNDNLHSLTGFQRINYINNSPDTLHFIWFHVWPNAYKNDQTAFSDQMLENGNTSFYFSDKDDKGYINKLNFKVNNVVAETEDHPEHIDIIKVVLPSPLPPGKNIEITTPFYVKLPTNYSRGGHDGQSYQATQWYPKPAVYDHTGWHPMAYLDQGEYYSEFGNYEVSITVPENYVVAATGVLQNQQERDWIKNRSSYYFEPIKKKIKTKGGGFKTVYDMFPPSAKEIKTIKFKQENVHDFAWFADKRYIVNYDTCMVNGKIIEVFNYYTSIHADPWRNNIGKIKSAIHHYSNLLGEYPYSTASVVLGPEGIGGGMEYPTITLISPMNDKELDLTIAHEIGHNWFYSALATNERDHPWMDEGMNSYYEELYHRKKYGEKEKPERIFLETREIEHNSQAINTGSQELSADNYGLIAYYKASEWMSYLEKILGTETFNKAMKAYYEEWKFRHPQPADFKRSLEGSSGKSLDSVFALLENKGALPHLERKGTSFHFIFSKPAFKNYLLNPPKNVISYGPMIGFNSYDKLMIGGIITNIKLPPSRFQFLAIPFYATGSKEFAGIGRMSYSFYPKKVFERIDIGVNAARFNKDRYTDTTGKYFLSFNKVVPGFRLTLRNKNERSEMLRYIQFKTFFIGEEFLRFHNDTIINTPDTTIKRNIPGSIAKNRVLNQLMIVFENARALYPYRAELKAEQGEGFVRLAFTGNYFFNYAKNKGGVDLCFFAGKFIYTNEEKADPYLYGLNLSAPKGNLDYTYSDYFIGRNDYPFRAGGEEWTIPYQQIMIRDGGLKVNTDAQGNTGWSDDWVAALNATFDIPNNLNPFSIFKINVPLKAFIDVGTYAQPWEKGATGDRFLYDIGVQVPIAKGLVNVYIPVLYSKVFKDYFKSTVEEKGRFFKTIAFSIDISKFNSKRFIKGFLF